MSDLRYPIGPFQKKPSISSQERDALIAHIAEVPVKLRAAVRSLSEPQIDTPYRPGGWSVRQVIHHVADSHMNSYIRFKLAATETDPPIKTYQEALWAELPDARTAPVEHSLALIDALHFRWALHLRTLDEIDFRRTMIHPANGVTTVDDLVQLYGWHGRHHTAHISELRARMGW